MKFIVELQEGVWIADWYQSPNYRARTLVKSSAYAFKSEKEAQKHLTQARNIEAKQFTNAKIWSEI